MAKASQVISGQWLQSSSFAVVVSFRQILRIIRAAMAKSREIRTHTRARRKSAALAHPLRACSGERRAGRGPRSKEQGWRRAGCEASCRYGASRYPQP
eukprot:scaffold6562_cov120-Isochrysis_galbana.AAC.8